MKHTANNSYPSATLEALALELIGANERVATAESVTAGKLQTAFASMANASACFEGGITVYNIKQKHKHLGIDPVKAIQCNAVSLEIAREMALAASKLFEADWGIGITGFASPMPEQSGTDLFAHFAISYHHHVVHEQTLAAPEGDKLRVLEYYTNRLLIEFERGIRTFRLETQHQ